MFQRICMPKTGLIAAVLCAATALGCQSGSPGERQEVVPELKLVGVRYRIWRGADLRAFGEAAEATLRRDSSELTALDLVANLPRQGEPVRITAPEGHGSLADRIFFAQGGVTLVQGADVAHTPSAEFDSSPEGGLVRGSEPLVVEGRGYRLEGIGFTLDPTSGAMDVHGPARLLAGLPEAP
jgi:lipopolysaccharide export system protein LptC